MDMFWLFTPAQLQQLHKMRNSAYGELLIDPEFNDRILEGFYLRNLIKIVRINKSLEQPFLKEKLVETAVNLFKRYYLVKSFMNADAQQVTMSATYLALKIEELGLEDIQRYVQKMSKKAYLNNQTNHYGQKNYTQSQMSFLSSINFQIKILSCVRPLQSLLARIREQLRDDSTTVLNIQKQMFKINEKIYFHDVFWLTHPAKRALAITLYLLRKYKVPQKSIDREGDMEGLIKGNAEEIEGLVRAVGGLPEVDINKEETISKINRFRDLIKNKNNQFKKPLKRNSVSSINHI